MVYDVIVIGGGPAGLTAAVYARRADRSVLVLEKGSFGGQITFSPKVENIPGFPEISGTEFADRFVGQALDLGADMESAEVLEVRPGDPMTVVTDDGSYQGKTVILATGAKHRTLGLPEEESYIGNGISFCAVCDGAFYSGREVVVVGGGNSALQEALLLADLCSRVTIVQNLAFLTGEAKLQAQIAARENVTILYETLVTGYLGEDGSLTGVVLEGPSGVTEMRTDGVFLAVGLIPQNEPFAALVPLKNGYVDADESCLTGTDGVFVAGDCRNKTVRQVATACSDGAVAALAACRYLDR
ncbi:MAG: FAD-dependent oxidoreductase [Clostridia bacterium]|nr:FAD-dependent oxidoreductase [Clostridia bacterium]